VATPERSSRATDSLTRAVESRQREAVALDQVIEVGSGDGTGHIRNHPSGAVISRGGPEIDPIDEAGPEELLDRTRREVGAEDAGEGVDLCDCPAQGLDPGADPIEEGRGGSAAAVEPGELEIQIGLGGLEPAGDLALLGEGERAIGPAGAVERQLDGNHSDGGDRVDLLPQVVGCDWPR